MTVEKRSISFAPEIWPELEKRAAGGALSTTLNRSLERYFAVLAACRRTLCEQLSDGEIALVCDAFNGIGFWDTVSVRLAWANVAGAIEMDGLDRKWNVDGPALVAKLKALDLAHATALVDAVETWWNRVGQGEKLQPTAAEVLDRRP